MLFWMMPDSGPNTKEDFTGFIENYKKKFPGEDIRVEILTRHNLWDKLFLMRFETDASKIPDAIEIPHSWTQFLIRSNLIENLSSIDPGLSLSKYLSPLWPHSCLEGSKDIYSLPWWIDVTAMHYRADHLELVSKNPEQDLSTWDGMLEVCAKLKRKFRHVHNYYPMQNSDWRGSLSIRNTLPCIWSRGIELFSKDNSKCNYTEPEFIAGMQDYIKLAQNKFMPVLQEKGSIGNMISGRASILITRRLGLNIFENTVNSFEARTLPIPQTGPVKTSFLSGINLVITKSSQKKEQALQFIKWFSEKENQIKYANLMEVLPAVEEAFDEYLFSTHKRMHVYLKIMSSARTLRPVTVASTATKILNEVLDVAAEAVVQGVYTQEILWKELQRTAKETDYLLSLYEG
ncbi:ABC-type glycerol-3-phosphate transport system substrate-binding protein [Elusimicrobium posterum]|uniref:extracellular solute-binding protein n=1 Tax=Elusimicrobium posterum TaxID=3116653 RepID=UPI003C77E708